MKVTENKSERFQMILLAVLTTALLLPFSSKPVHLDDPMYIWVAKHVLSSPLNFYGFDVNWSDYLEPMPNAMQNPPLVSYYMAFVSLFADFGETVLHLSFIPQSIAVVLATFIIAKRFTSSLMLASLAALATPVFLLSSTTLMSDMLMLAFFCWAIVFWIKGAEQKKTAYLLIAGLLIAASTLTKYFGIGLIPLLMAYSVFKRERLKDWLPWMIIPIAILVMYQLATKGMYGRGLLFDAASYATKTRTNSAESVFTGLVFAGGCVITALFYAPYIWRKLSLSIFGALIIITGALLFWMKAYGGLPLVTEVGVSWTALAELSVFGVAGLSIVVLAFAEFFRRRDAITLLLLFWILGTFAFASVFNWTVSGRSILAMAPAAGILIAGRLEEMKVSGVLKYVPLVPSVILSILVAWADYGWAKAVKNVAETINEKYISKGAEVYFQGHWGFQYYMEEKGAKAVDWNRPLIPRDSLIVVSVNNTANKPFPIERFREIEEVRVTSFRLIATMYPPTGAGFYTSLWGPLPYSFGSAFDESFIILTADTDTSLF